ncbi:MAG TPA: glycerol kinase GlpK [Acidimicrobiales bacterium]|nr:glycerol kinase GlpK [Acidimicrobiales bacterium]
MRSLLLAIDQGTTSTRALLVDPAGGVLARCSREIRQYYPHPSWVEHDPEEIWRSVLECAFEVLDQAGRSARDLAGIGIANQRETTVLWERSTGRPVQRAIVWQDRRSTAICEELRASGVAETIADRTGLTVDPYFSATKLAWSFRHDPLLVQRARRGEICFGTIDAWLVWKLTGGACHVTEPTNASRTLLLDLRALAFAPDLLDLFGIPPEVLPTIVPSGTPTGERPDAHLAGESVPILAVLGDQQSALFAQACLEPGLAKSTYGTGSFVLGHAGEGRVAGGGELLCTVAVGERAGRSTYALEGSILSTGSAVQWLRDGLGVIRAAAETEQLAASLPGNDDVWFVPALAGLGAPYWDPGARGTLLGVTRATTRAHVARAVLEGIAWRTRDVLEAMARAGSPVRELRADGGATANRWLMQFQADALGIPVDVAASREATALGVAYLAGIVAGIWRREDVARLRRSAGRFEPNASDDERESAYRRWQEAVARSARWARP